MSATDPEWELLPPGEKAKRNAVEPLFRWLALLMDNFLRVPGTNFRVGIDPLIGMLPGVGDMASAIASAVALIYAARQGLPKILLARMASNILINELIGIIPGVGDAFSFWFKSNARNHALLKSYSATPSASRKSDWIFLAAILILLFVIVCAGLLVSAYLLIILGRALSGRSIAH